MIHTHHARVTPACTANARTTIHSWELELFYSYLDIFMTISSLIMCTEIRDSDWRHICISDY